MSLRARRPRRTAAERADPEPRAQFDAALDLALGYLAPRPRSQREVRQRLLHGGFTAGTADEVLAALARQGLVDDDAFARYWVEQRRQFRPRGARLLSLELRQHGVAADLAEASSQTVADDAEEDAYRAARARARALRALDEATFKQRLGQFLARRGFGWDVITPTVRRLWQEAAEL